MNEFFFTAAASFIGALFAIIVCYCAVLYSRGEGRRALSVLVAAIFTLTTTSWFLYALMDGARAFILVSAIFMASIGWFWLIRDVAFSMNQEP